MQRVAESGRDLPSNGVAAVNSSMDECGMVSGFDLDLMLNGNETIINVDPETV